MKVKELIAELGKLDKELEVVCYTEDANLLEKGHGFRILVPLSIETTEGKRFRDKNGVPSLDLDSTEEKMATIIVTGDF